MELLNLLLFVAITDRKKVEKKRLPYFEKRKQEYNASRERINKRLDWYAKKAVEIQDISLYINGKEAFDSDLKRIRKFFGNKAADNFLKRIEKVNPTDFDAIKYL